jgi:hypothetical protein
MAQPPNLEARVAALEARVSELDERYAGAGRTRRPRESWLAARIAT